MAPLLDHLFRLPARRHVFSLTGARRFRLPVRRRLFEAQIMAVAEVPKDPEEILDFGFEYADLLPGGDTIVGSTWSASGITIEDDSTTTTTAEVWLSGGDVGAKYKVKNIVTTANGRTIVRRLVVVVQEM